MRLDVVGSGRSRVSTAKLSRKLPGPSLGCELAGRLSLIRLSLLLLGCRPASMSEAKSGGGGEAAAKAVGPLFRSAHPPIQQIKSIYKGDTNEQGGERKGNDRIYTSPHPSSKHK
jgi:hypothetical protein